MIFLALFYLIITFILGIITVFLLPITIPRWAKILVGPALGLIIVTQITLLICLIAGFNTQAIIFSLFIYICVSIWLARKAYLKSKLSFEISLARMTEKIVTFTKQYWPLWIIFFTIGSLSIYVFTTKILALTDFGLITGGEGLYGDTALHSGYTSSILYQGLPPKNPLSAGQPLIYPFLTDLTAAILINLSGSLNFAFSLPQIAYFFGFTTLFYMITRKFTDNRGTFFAMLIFFLGWGLGFTDFLKNVNTSHSWPITEEYTNSSGMFKLHNPLTGLIFPERSLLPGLFIGMLITLIVIASRRRSNPVQTEIAVSPDGHRGPRNDNILIGLLLGILPLWHTHTFIFFGVSVGVWWLVLLFERSCQRLFSNEGGRVENYPGKLLDFARRINIKSLIFVYSLATIISLPVLVWFHSQIGHGSFITFHLGWMDSSKNFVLFWWKNTGLLIPLALLGIWKLKSAKYKLFFVAPFLLFIVGNIVQFQPWDWDNIKLFTWVFLFLSIPAGYAISTMLSLSNNNTRNLGPLIPGILTKLVCFSFFLSLILSGTLSLIYFLPMTFTVYDKNDIDLANWIKKNTNPSDVFLIDPWPNHPVPGLSGRSVYVGYPGHLWVHGIEYGDREQEVKKILSGNLTQLNDLDVPVNYIAVENTHDTLQEKLDLSQVFANQKFHIYQIKTP